jgi:hypothetical protein
MCACACTHGEVLSPQISDNRRTATGAMPPQRGQHTCMRQPQARQMHRWREANSRQRKKRVAVHMRNTQPAVDNAPCNVQRSVVHATLTTRRGAQGQPSANAGEKADGTEQYFRVLGYLTDGCNGTCDVANSLRSVRKQQKTRSVQRINRTAWRRRAQRRNHRMHRDIWTCDVQSPTLHLPQLHLIDSS